MWYFAWILGIGLALAAAIINVMWLEANYAFGLRDEDATRDKFERFSKGLAAAPPPSPASPPPPPEHGAA